MTNDVKVGDMVRLHSHYEGGQNKIGRVTELVGCGIVKIGFMDNYGVSQIYYFEDTEYTLLASKHTIATNCLSKNVILTHNYI
jgi:hypothetical protein